MNKFFDHLETNKNLISLLKKEKYLEITGLNNLALGFQIYKLKKEINDTPIFLFLSEEEIKKIIHQLKFCQKFFQSFQSKIEEIELHPKTLYFLIKKSPTLYIFSFNSLKKQLLLPFQFEDLILNLKVDQKNSKNKNLIHELIKKLVILNYKQERKTFFSGNFSRRGGILDVFSPQSEFPFRIEFFADQIENIFTFDPKTNKKIKNLNMIDIIPAKLNKGNGTLLNYFENFTNQQDLKNIKTPIIIYKEFENELDFEIREKFKKTIKNFYQIKISSFKTPKTKFSFSYTSPPFYRRQFSFFQKEIKSLQKEKWQIFILTSHKKELEKLFPINLNLTFIQNSIEEIKVSGFQNQKTKLLFLTDYEIFKLPQSLPNLQKKKINLTFISELKPNDYIVHIDHGIGKFVGITKRKIDGVEREFFVLEYAQGDRLYLPCEYAERITKYVGKSHPLIYRLHGALWNNIKQKVKKNIEKFASELLNLYAKREISSGFIFSPDTLAQKELEDSFEYEETEDQIKILKEIKNDMEGKFSNNLLKLQSPLNFDLSKNLLKKPMDRLICGDVGFGKTELAVRAAFKATQDKKQVAVLCPTTILAQQHFETFSSRLKKFPVKVALLSRLETKLKQKEILKNLSLGKIDIIIGTHRLLSSDVKFFDLGLLIIDEEQRFGVKQKEKLKKLKENIDVLTLSATPIPRTLHLALSGLRDISLLSTPLPGRLPIETFIMPYNEKIICQAIMYEVNRNGQVFFVHNRVKTIEETKQKLQKLLPSIRFCIAHGRLNETELIKTISNFYHHKFDVLICSSIIENGIDLSNVNTLIVDEATRFGLADLYQLRGRVGRGNKKAYAYFFYQTKNLKKSAKLRLEALLEAKELGSGFKIAYKDLEIRGAGNILGKEQSGNLEAVGLSLYCQLLSQAIEKIKSGKTQEEFFDVSIDLPINAYIPKTFVSSEKERIIMYQKMSSIFDLLELKKFKEKILSYKRKISPELLSLFEILEIKILARKAKVEKIYTKSITPLRGKKLYYLILKLKNKILPEIAVKLLQKNKNLQFSDFEIKIKIEQNKNWLFDLKNYLMILAQ